MGDGRLAKDVQYLRRHLAAQSAGQAEVVEVDDNLEFIVVHVTPSDGLYKHATVKFKIYFDHTIYPADVPVVICLTNVYHPNIDAQDVESYETDRNSNVCVSLLSEWEEAMGLDHVVMALLFLFYNPAIDDALSPAFDSCLEWDEYEKNVWDSLRGRDIDGIDFDCLITPGDDEEKEEEKKKKDGDEIEGSDSTNSEGEKICDNSTTTPVATTTNDTGSANATTNAPTNASAENSTAADIENNKANEDDTASIKLSLSRQNSIASGSNKDINAVVTVIFKTDGTGSRTQPEYRTGCFGFEIFPTVKRTIVRSMNALLCNFHTEKASPPLAGEVRWEDMDSEVD